MLQLLEGSASWKLAGITVRTLSPAETVVDMPLGPQHFHSGGVVHGGLISMLVDSAAVAVLFPSLADHEVVLTVELKVNFFSPGRGTHLAGHARVLKRGRRLAVVTVDVVDDRQEVIAHGIVTQLIEPRNGEVGQG